MPRINLIIIEGVLIILLVLFAGFLAYQNQNLTKLIKMQAQVTLTPAPTASPSPSVTPSTSPSPTLTPTIKPTIKASPINTFAP